MRGTVPAILALSGLLLGAPAARAHGPHGSGVARPDAHAPIGVMGEHLHGAGGRMLSYRYMRMRMDGNRDGTERIGTGAVLADYPVAPTRMDMEMHMLGVMWAPIDRITLLAMLPFLRQDMDHVTATGVRFTTRSSGIGDVRVAGLIRLFDGETHRLHANAGLSVPTGDISVKDDTPMGRVRLPYPMQLGSGTFDLLPGVTYTGQTQAYSWGGQLLGTIRTGRNNKGYRLGNRADASVWGARRWAPWLSTSLRLAWASWDNIHGDDDALNPALVPTADPDRRRGHRLDGLLGANLIVTQGVLRNQRFAVEFGWPLYQWLDGPQLETDWQLWAGWQYAF
ncbi:MAG: transporter [Deltaproteobacteria bacterium]|nr:MAG: transporter [Deltaproteobacteria bacterium]